MDFLGLRTLTVIDDAVKSAKAVEGVDIDIENLPLDDPEVFRLFQEGRTKGVFQFESGGMVDLLRKSRPTQFEDLAALNALYRPGALDAGMVDDYVRCKNGSSKPKYLVPADEGTARGDVRRHRLPGAGHADRAARGRLLARPGRSAAQGDGQEGRRGHGRRSAASSSTARSPTATTRRRRTRSSTTSSRSPATASTSRTRWPTRWSRIRRPG